MNALSHVALTDLHSFSAALSPETPRHYRGTARNFLGCADHPEVNSGAIADESISSVGSRIAPHLPLCRESCWSEMHSESGGSGGTHDQLSFQDLSKRSKGAQEPLPLHRQQHVRPCGS